METTLPLDWFNATEPLGNYTFVLPFERHWNRTGATIWMQRNWTLSIWLSALYVALIFGGQKLMSRRRAFELRTPLAVWNGLLSLFSIVGFVRSSPEFMRVLFGHGFQHSVCVPSYSQDSVAGFWMEAFILSKAAELIDTVFIVARKRPLIFLHWYHHVTVLIYCWHAMKDHTAAGRWFSWMNFIVHSVMYAYYAASALKYRLPRWVSMLITSMQLSQMIIGCYMVYYVYDMKTNHPDQMCHQTFENLYFCFGIYFTYFLLFLKFFYDAYMKPSGKKPTSAAAKTVAGEKPVIKGGEQVEDQHQHQNGVLLASNGALKNGVRSRNGYHHIDNHHHDQSNNNVDASRMTKKRD